MPVRAALAPERRIEALDVLRGVALAGIYVMNMPGFSQSLFSSPPSGVGGIDGWTVWLRELLFAGKFNLMFGMLFGIGFSLQLRRLEAGRPGGATWLYARRLAVLLAIGLVHAWLLWAGDVLVVYALLGFGLLAIRRWRDGAIVALLAACLVYPAVSDALRTAHPSFGADTFSAFEFEAFERTNAEAIGQGNLLEAAAENARVMAWFYGTPLGRYSLVAFYVQMATGILIGCLVGRRGWVERLPALARSMQRAQLAALLLVLVAGAASFVLPAPGTTESIPVEIASGLARTLGRAALMIFYALTILRLLRHPAAARCLHPFALAGRMPLSNYLMQTLLASFVFYGWGLGFWGQATPLAEVLLALGLFAFVQLPLSAAWLSRFRYGPVEWVWRRLTYGARPNSAASSP